jgi:hypothetical protein
VGHFRVSGSLVKITEELEFWDAELVRFREDMIVRRQSACLLT